MTNSIEREALRLCEAALEQPAGQREAWLLEQCADDAELFERTRRLLDRVQDTEFEPTLAPMAYFKPDESEPPPPERLGAYRVLELIGRGGMGAVYRAERADGAFERTVAIKLVGSIHSRSDAEQRFTNERRILAQMRHPNIAQLLDGGTDDGRGYLVMEYVEGKPFSYDETRPMPEQLNAFRKVCTAVQYAHNNLVLHRDIKPDNVLIDANGEPKLLDFGIAKLNQELTETGAGDVTGTKAAPLTLNYSAPERLLGEPATVSSDVYSLGVFLFVLLHGVRPYDLSGKTLPEAWKELRERTAENTKDAFGDIGLIAEKAMHNDAGERYNSAAELAADIRRFQEGQTVTARPADWRYSFGRFVARNKTAALASTAGLVMLVASLVFTALAYLESERQTQIAETEATTATQAVEFLRTVLSSANPFVSDQKELTVKEVLQFAKQKLEAGEIESPSARAAVETSLALAHDGRGEYEQALEYAEAAVTKFDAESVRNASQRTSLYALALVLVHSDQSQRAVEVIDRLLAEAKTANAMETWDIVEAETLLGNAQEDLALESEAILSYSQALRRANRKPGGKDNAVAKIVLLNNYGRLLHQQGDYASALRYYNESLSLSRLNNGAALRQAVLLSNIAGVHGDQQQWEEAIRLLKESLTLHGAANNLDGPNALISQTTLANFQRQSGDLKSAEITVQAALDTASKVLAEDHFITAYIQNIAAVTFCSTDKWPLGLDYAKRSLATREQIMPPGHWIIPSGRSVLGRCETRAGNYARARRLLEESLASLIELRGEDGTQARQTRYRLELLAAAEQDENAELDQRQPD